MSYRKWNPRFEEQNIPISYSGREDLEVRRYSQRSCSRLPAAIPGVALFRRERCAAWSIQVKEEAQDRPILIDNEMGLFLTTAKIWKCLRSSFESEFPGLPQVTAISLCSSYCTMAMRSHCNAEIFRDLRGARFLRLLAKDANISVEPLQNPMLEWSSKILNVWARNSEIAFQQSTASHSDHFHVSKHSKILSLLHLSTR